MTFGVRKAKGTGGSFEDGLRREGHKEAVLGGIRVIIGPFEKLDSGENKIGWEICIPDADMEHSTLYWPEDEGRQKDIMDKLLVLAEQAAGDPNRLSELLSEIIYET